MKSSGTDGFVHSPKSGGSSTPSWLLDNGSPGPAKDKSMNWVSYEEYDPLGNGQYPSEITGVEGVESDRFTDKNGRPARQYCFTLELLEPVHADRTLLVWATATMSSRSKLGRDLVGPLFGNEWLKENPFNSEYMVGLRVVALVSEKIKDDGTKIDHVTGFRAIPKQWENGSYTVEMAKARMSEAYQAEQETTNVPEKAAAPARTPVQAELPTDPVGEPPLTGEQQTMLS